MKTLLLALVLVNTAFADDVHDANNHTVNSVDNETSAYTAPNLERLGNTSTTCLKDTDPGCQRVYSDEEMTAKLKKIDQEVKALTERFNRLSK